MVKEIEYYENLYDTLQDAATSILDAVGYMRIELKKSGSDIWLDEIRILSKQLLTGIDAEILKSVRAPSTRKQDSVYTLLFDIENLFEEIQDNINYLGDLLEDEDEELDTYIEDIAFAAKQIASDIYVYRDNI